MDHFFRVFGRGEEMPAPEGFLAALRGRGLAVQGNFEGDEEGWFLAELTLAEGGLVVERYLSHEEGLRNELNSWAAVLEEHEGNANAVPLMERAIQSRQFFTLRPGSLDGDLRRACHLVCQVLAGLTGGFYQADGEGFFEADGTLLVREG